MLASQEGLCSMELLYVCGCIYQLCSLLAGNLCLLKNLWVEKCCILFPPSTVILTSLYKYVVLSIPTNITWSRFPLSLYVIFLLSVDRCAVCVQCFYVRYKSWSHQTLKPPTNNWRLHAVPSSNKAGCSHSTTLAFLVLRLLLLFAFSPIIDVFSRLNAWKMSF